MPDKPTPRQRRILRLVRRYQRLMGLDRWDVTVRFEVDKEDAAGCSADDEYLRAMLSFDLNGFPPEDDDTFVRHELLHCVVWEMLRVAEGLAGENEAAKEAVRAANERCVTMLERMPIWQAK